MSKKTCFIIQKSEHLCIVLNSAPSRYKSHERGGEIVEETFFSKMPFKPSKLEPIFDNVLRFFPKIFFKLINWGLPFKRFCSKMPFYPSNCSQSLFLRFSKKFKLSLWSFDLKQSSVLSLKIHNLFYSVVKQNSQ